MSNENEFYFLGKFYVAVESKSSKCDGCALDEETDIGYCLDVDEIHPCIARKRIDARNVIYVEKRP